MKTGKDAGVPVAPNAVRVWRGFRSVNAGEDGASAWRRFVHFLENTLFPVESTWRVNFGLTCYIAGVKHPEGDPRAPDEFALVFYESQEVYDAGTATVAGSLYPLFPAPYFRAGTSGYPLLFDGELQPGVASYLFEQAVDWYGGSVRCLVGVTRPGTTPQELADEASMALAHAQAEPPPGLDGVIVMVDPDPDEASAGHLVYWEHWSGNSATQNGIIDKLAGLVEVAFRQDAQPMKVKGGFYQANPTITPRVAGDQLLRLHLERRLAREEDGQAVWGMPDAVL